MAPPLQPCTRAIIAVSCAVILASALPSGYDDKTPAAEMEAVWAADGVIYEIERLLNVGQRDGRDMFLVKWAGFPEEEATWEMAGHLPSNLVERAYLHFKYQPQDPPEEEEAETKDVDFVEGVTRPFEVEVSLIYKASWVFFFIMSGMVVGMVVPSLKYWLESSNRGSLLPTTGGTSLIAVDAAMKNAPQVLDANSPRRRKKKLEACPPSPPGCENKCTICLSGAGPPLPVQSGCACRGSAGLAHIECRVETARHFGGTNRKVWWKCGTCNQDYSGATQMALAQEWVWRTKFLPADNEERLLAASNLAAAFRSIADYDTAAGIYEEVLATTERAHGANHSLSLHISSDLASAYNYQGKNKEAEVIQRRLLQIEQTLYGVDHSSTLATENNLASSLRDQGKLEEAAKLQRRTVEAASRVFGKDHHNVMSATSNLARTLSRQGEHDEAVALLRGVVIAAKRVFGNDHQDTLAQTHFLAAALHRHGEYAEAGLIYEQLLPKMKSSYGKDHVNVFSVSEHLSSCKVKMKTQKTKKRLKF